MDFLFDPDLVKAAKPYGVAAVGMIAVCTIAYIFNRFSEQKDDEEDVSPSRSKQKPSGIYNKGNTCFVNSVLQALFPLQPLRKTLKDVLDMSQNQHNNTYAVIKQLYIVLEKLNSQNDNLDINDFLTSVGNYSELINFEQQDAYELYSVIITALETLSNENKSIALNRSSLSANSSNQLEDIFINCEPKQQKNNENCLLGLTKSSITCQTCFEQKNIKIQPFFDLSFDICDPLVTNLSQAFRKYQSKEFIDGWNCCRCSVNQHLKMLEKTKQYAIKNKVPHWQTLSKIGQQIYDFLSKMSLQEMQTYEVNEKLANFIFGFEKEYLEIGENPIREKVFNQITPIERKICKECKITKFPEILVIHLKQLSMDPLTGELCLLKKKIDYPKQMIVQTRSGQKKYRLSSLISHSGSQNYGHYFSFRKVEQEGQEHWFLISDTEVIECSQKTLKLYMPYMMFYSIVPNEDKKEQNKNQMRQ